MCFFSKKKPSVLEFLYTSEGKELYFYNSGGSVCCKNNFVFSYDLKHIVNSYITKYEKKPIYIYRKINGYRRFKIVYNGDTAMSIKRNGSVFFNPINNNG